MQLVGLQHLVEISSGQALEAAALGAGGHAPGAGPFVGPDTSMQLAALKHLEEIAGGQGAPGHQSLAAYVRPLAPPGQPGPTTARLNRLARPVRTRWARLPLLHRVPLPLAIVLLAQAGLSLRLVWSNTAFADEALYLWAGHLEWAHWLDGASIAKEGLPTYFSGAPAVYPPLGALADSLGGLAGARLLSLAFMLCATSLLYSTTKRLFDGKAAVYAVALYAGIGSTQFLGAFATYDAMALFLLTLATWLGVRAADRARRPGRPAVARLLATAGLLSGSGAALAVADAAKYASTLFNPVVLGVILLASWRTDGARQAMTRTVAVLSVAAGLITAFLLMGGSPYWKGITWTTLSRASGTVPIPAVFSASGEWVGAIAFLAVCGAAATASRDRPTRLLGCLLVVAIFLAPIEQARIHLEVSLFKHVDYGAWFGCIIAGFALGSLQRAVPSTKVPAAARLGFVTAAIAAVGGLTLAGAHFAGWPNTTRMVAVLDQALPRYGCPCLVAQNNVVNYYLPRQAAPHHLVNSFTFYYWDDATHREVSGVPAYDRAIEDRYFSLIEIDPSFNRVVYTAVARLLPRTYGYTLIYSGPSRTAGAPLEIWVLNGASS